MPSSIEQRLRLLSVICILGSILLYALFEFTDKSPPSEGPSSGIVLLIPGLVTGILLGIFSVICRLRPPT